MWKNMVQPGRPQLTKIIRRMRFASYIPKATDPHSEYVILNTFARQRSLRQRASLLCWYPHFLYFSTIIWNLHLMQLVKCINKTYKQNGRAVSRQWSTFVTVLVWVELYGQCAVLTVMCGRCNLLANPTTRDARCIWFGRDGCSVVSLISVCSLFSSQSVSVFWNFIHRLVLRRSTASQKLVVCVLRWKVRNGRDLLSWFWHAQGAVLNYWTGTDLEFQTFIASKKRRTKSVKRPQTFPNFCSVSGQALLRLTK